MFCRCCTLHLVCCSQFVCSLMDPLVEHYKQATSFASLDAAAKQQLSVLEGQLAWMVSIVGSVIRGRCARQGATAPSAVGAVGIACVLSHMPWQEVLTSQMQHTTPSSPMAFRDRIAGNAAAGLAVH